MMENTHWISIPKNEIIIEFIRSGVCFLILCGVGLGVTGEVVHNNQDILKPASTSF